MILWAIFQAFDLIFMFSREKNENDVQSAMCV